MNGPEPGAPLETLTALVSVMTALLVTVVVSVFDAYGAGVTTLEPVTVMVFVAVAVFGKVATTMNLNCALAASEPVLVIAAPVG